MRRQPLRIDLSKRLWHDATRMSLKETFARPVCCAPVRVPSICQRRRLHLPRVPDIRPITVLR